MPRGRGRGPQMSNEKAKDFKGTMKKLMAYLSAYKIGIFFVIVFAIGSTIFNIVGPKILGKATTEIFKGLVRKVSGGSGIDFDKIAHIVLTLLCLYLTSAVFSFVQGYIMTGFFLRRSLQRNSLGIFQGTCYLQHFFQDTGITFFRATFASISTFFCATFHSCIKKFPDAI